MQPYEIDAMIRCQDVHKRFGRLEVLRGVSFDVAKGEVVVIAGPSGSGKSTLLRCINHLEAVNKGRIYVDGQPVGYREVKGKFVEKSEREVARMRASIGMVFQRFNLFPHLTALGNVIDAPIHVRKMGRSEALESRPSDAGKGRPGRQARHLSGPAFRGSAAAGGHRSRPGHGAQGNALRRAHIGPGPGAGRRGARGDEVAGAGGNDHDRGYP